MKNPRANTKFLRVLIIAVLFAVIAALIYVILKRALPGFLGVIESGSQAEIQAYIRANGDLRGMFLTFLLQFMQIISILFPGAPIQIAAGIVFGTWAGFLICEAGYVSANVLVFAASRKLSGKLDDLFPMEGKAGHLMAMIRNSQHPVFMVFIACLMPFLANGIIPYIASKTRMHLWQYVTAISLGCAPNILVLCSAGNELLAGNYIRAILLFVFLIVAILAFYFLRNRIYALAERMHIGSGKKEPPDQNV